MISGNTLFILVSLGIAESISAILLLLCFFKVIARKIFVISVAVLNIIATLVMGLHDKLRWNHLLLEMAIITIFMSLCFTIPLFLEDWYNTAFKQSPKNDKDSK